MLTLNADCFQAAPSQRIATVFDAVRKARNQDVDEEPRENENLAQFTQYECLTLPHLIALVSRPTTRSVPRNVGLVVVSSATALINSALPRPQDGKQGLNVNRGMSFFECIRPMRLIPPRSNSLSETETGIAVDHESSPDAGLNTELRSCLALTMCYQDAV